MQRDLGGMGKGAAIDQEMAEIKEALLEHVGVICNTFAYYAALGRNSESHDGYSMSMAAFFEHMRACNIVEEDSAYCKVSDLESIFIAVNIEDTGSNVAHEQKMLNMVNDDKALVRFEYMQVLVRLAVAKYVRTKRTGDVSEALHTLMKRDMKPNLPPEAHHKADDFRKLRLYREDVDTVYRRFQDKLYAVFMHYSIPEQELTIGPKDPLKRGPNVLTLFGWETFLNDCRLLASDDEQGAKERIDRFSISHIKLAFIWSQPFVSDELKRRHKLIGLQYVDFLEAIARLCTMMRLPSVPDLLHYQCASYKEFYDQVEAGHTTGDAIQGDLGGEVGDDILLRHWQVAETSTTPLGEVLDLLLQLMIDRLTERGFGDPKMFKSRKGLGGKQSSKGGAAAKRGSASRKLVTGGGSITGQ